MSFLRLLVVVETIFQLRDQNLIFLVCRRAIVGAYVSVAGRRRCARVLREGVAPPVLLEATHVSALEFVTLEELRSREFQEE